MSQLDFNDIDQKEIQSIADEDGSEIEALLGQTLITNNAPRRSALQLLEHMFRSDPTSLPFHPIPNVRPMRPQLFTNQMIQSRSMRLAKTKEYETESRQSLQRLTTEDQKHTPTAVSDSNTTQTHSTNLSYKPSFNDADNVRNIIMTKLPLLQALDECLPQGSIPQFNAVKANRTMLVMWCDPVVPGGSWLRCGQGSFFDQDETDLFTSSSIFAHCLPNEIAYQLPLRDAASFWLQNIKLYRTAEGKKLPTGPVAKPTFSCALLPWVPKQDLVVPSSHTFIDQLFLVLQLAYLHGIENIVLSLDRWSSDGYAPVEIAQRFVQCLNKFSQQHPTNILFLKQAKISITIRPEAFGIWLPCFQSALTSDTRAKEEQQRQQEAIASPPVPASATPHATTNQVQNRESNTRRALNPAPLANTSVDIDRDREVKAQALQRTMSAGRRLLAAERLRNQRERYLYMQPRALGQRAAVRVVETTQSHESPRYQNPTFSSSQRSTPKQHISRK